MLSETINPKKQTNNQDKPD